MLITGHDGFIGAHLVDKLKKKYNLIGISNHNSDSSITSIKKDIQKISIKDFPKNIDYIIHLAAVTDVQYCERNPQNSFAINCDGTKKILEVARNLGSKFLYVSTSHVYGNPQKLPIVENHSRNPTSVYAATKLLAENLCESYSRIYGLNVDIIRLFSVYGPKSPKYLVTSKIISQSLEKKPVIMGNLKPRRDFIYISDAISAIELIMKKSPQSLESYNVCSGKSYSISQIYGMVSKLLGYKIPIKTSKTQIRKNDIFEIRGSCSKLQNLGWRKKTNLTDGLEKTILWYKTLQNNTD